MQTIKIESTLQSGKYTIKKVLGQGGFGITYLAEHNWLGTKVAIKEFFMKELNNRDESTSQVSVGSEGSRELVMKFRDKFIKEARNIASLNHPNIIRIHDVFEENGTAYYVMEYCDGESLNELLKMHPAGLGEALAVKYIRQAASALQYIHERKMNHLDVKPANIMLNAGNAVLIDFGLSKQYDSTGSQTSTTPVGISHGFAPIEQYKQGGVSEFSPATDIYSLGATLYKLITGQTPPDAQTLIEEDLPMINASASVTNAIRQAMQVSRSNRPQSITAWLQLLGSSAKSSIDDESTRVIQRQKEPNKSGRGKTFGWFVIVAAILGYVFYYFYSNREISYTFRIAAYEDSGIDDNGDYDSTSKKKQISGAVIYVDGVNTGKTTPGVVTLKEGNHTLRIEHPDYEDYVPAEGIGDLNVYHYWEDGGSSSRDVWMKSKYRWLNDKDVYKYHYWSASHLKDGYDASDLKRSLEAIGLEIISYDEEGCWTRKKDSLYKRKTKDGNTEYAVQASFSSPLEKIILGNYNSHGKNFNAKIKGQEDYLNIE